MWLAGRYDYSNPTGFLAPHRLFKNSRTGRLVGPAIIDSNAQREGIGLLQGGSDKSRILKIFLENLTAQLKINRF
jgi:hypothetical protein